MVSNRSSIIVSFYKKEVLHEASHRSYMEADVSIVNNSRRTKYINRIMLIYSPEIYPHSMISQELIKVEPEEEIRIPIHLDQGYIEKNRVRRSILRSAKALVSDTKGKNGSRKLGLRNWNCIGY